MLIKTNTKGVEQWSRNFGGPENDSVNSIIQIADRPFVITGSTGDSFTEGSDMLLVKINVVSEKTSGFSPIILLITAVALISCFKQKKIA